MKSIIISGIKNRLTSLVIFCGSAIGFIWLYTGMFPMFADQAEEFTKLLETFPKEFMDTFGFQGNMFFDSIQNFLATEMFSFVWPIMAISIAVGIAGSAIAEEIDKNTIETLLAQPISRTKIYFGKYIAGMVNLVIFVFITIYSIPLLAKLYGLDYQLSHFLPTALVGLLFALSIYSIGFLVSSISSKKGLVTFLTVGIVLLTYVTNIVSTLKDSLDSLKYFSFFYYFDPASLLARGEVIDYSYLALGGIIIATTAVGWYLFNRRDISV